jgi:hypothetical protein
MFSSANYVNTFLNYTLISSVSLFIISLLLSLLLAFKSLVLNRVIKDYPPITSRL